MLTRKRIMMIAVIVLALGAGSWGGYAVYQAVSPPPMPETVEDVEKLLSDDRYQSMSNAEQRPYSRLQSERLPDFRRTRNSRPPARFQNGIVGRVE